MAWMDNAAGIWVNPDGTMREARIKGGPLFEAFHGMASASRERSLSASRDDLARAYASAVWAYRCIKVRADAVAGVPLVLKDRNGALIRDHALVRLLADVNPTTMNLSDLLRATESAYNIWGVAYWLKIGGGNGKRAGFKPAPTNGRAVRWLQWLNPQTIEPQIDAMSGITGYRQVIGRETRLYAPEEIVVFRNFNPLDDLGGLSPLSVALSEVNAELNAARFVAAFFANDARPAGLLTTDQRLHEGDMERVQSWWERMFRGPANKFKTGIVSSGMRWQPISFAPNNLALGELRAEDRRSICAAFGVPAGLAGAWEATTYATAHEQKASFYEDTILPQLAYVAEVLNWSLLPHYPDLTARGAKLAWDTDDIAALRETATDRAQRLIALKGAGIMTAEEVRAELGLPDIASSPMTEAGAGLSPAPADDGEFVKAVRPIEWPLDDPARQRVDLARWQQHALRRLRRGKPPLAERPFTSTSIPADFYRRIQQALAIAQTPDDVRAAFTLDFNADTQPVEDQPEGEGEGSKDIDLVPPSLNIGIPNPAIPMPEGGR